MADREWPFVHWLAGFRAVYEPDNLGANVCVGAGRLAELEVTTDPEWQEITRCFVSAVQAWFTARGVRQEGWKRDSAHVMSTDPAFFDLLERWLEATELSTRHDLYRRIVELALEPLGGPLPTGKLLQPSGHEWEQLGAG